MDDEHLAPSAQMYSGEDQAQFLETLHEMTWWMYDNTCIGMGAERQFDYTMRGDLGADLSPRLGQCYELAVGAFTGWEKFSAQLFARNEVVLDLPAPEYLVHGTIEHRDPAVSYNGRISHAWVILEDGRVWEPVTGLICNATLFNEHNQTQGEHRYTGTVARTMMLRHQHYGPWH